MDDLSQSDRYEQEIVRRMEEKETEELVHIWQENDREAWTDEAFEVVKKILLERLGELPEQGQPEVEEDEEAEAEEEEGEGRLVIPFPTDKKLVWIADTSILLSKIILVFGLAYTVVICVDSLAGTLIDLGVETPFGIFFAFLTAAAGAMSYGFIYLVLQAIAEIIYLLLDIRELSRPETLANIETA